MNKSFFSLIAAAGLLAAGGVAQAQTQMPGPISGHTVITTTAAGGGQTYWIDTPVIVGVPSSTPTDTATMGAGPSMSTSTYVRQGWNGSYDQRHDASATWNVPASAGEASTMTNGQPNMLTDNHQLSGNTYVPVYTTPF